MYFLLLSVILIDGLKFHLHTVVFLDVFLLPDILKKQQGILVALFPSADLLFLVVHKIAFAQTSLLGLLHPFVLSPFVFHTSLIQIRIPLSLLSSAYDGSEFFLYGDYLHRLLGVLYLVIFPMDYLFVNILKQLQLAILKIKSRDSNV